MTNENSRWIISSLYESDEETGFDPELWWIRCSRKSKIDRKSMSRYVRRSCLKLKSIIISFSGWKLLISYWLFISYLVKVSKKVRNFSKSNPKTSLYLILPKPTQFQPTEFPFLVGFSFKTIFAPQFRRTSSCPR